VALLILSPLRAISWVYYFQPAVLRRLWGRAFGAVLCVIGLRSKVVRQNLAIAFPGQDDRALYSAAYEHLGHLFFEILMLLGPMRKFVMSQVDISGLEHWRAARALGKGSIFLASHVGNWEVMAAGGAFQAGIDLMMVTKRLKPAWLHDAIEDGRSLCRVDATYEPRTLKDILRHLKNNGTCGIVLDQYAGPPIGVRVPFFGQAVGTSTAFAALVRRTGAAVLPVVNYRKPGGRIQITIRPMISWIHDEDQAVELARNTAQYASILEADVRTHPEQWLWIHRRFKGDLSPLRSDEWLEGRSRR